MGVIEVAVEFVGAGLSEATGLRVVVMARRVHALRVELAQAGNRTRNRFEVRDGNHVGCCNSICPLVEL